MIAARGHDREIGDRPFGPVLGDQQHPIAGRHAPGAQRARQEPHLAADPLPGPGAIGAVALGPEERRARPAAWRCARTARPDSDPRSGGGMRISRAHRRCGRAMRLPRGGAGRRRPLLSRFGRTDNRIRLDWPVARCYMCLGSITGVRAWRMPRQQAERTTAGARRAAAAGRGILRDLYAAPDAPEVEADLERAAAVATALADGVQGPARRARRRRAGAR